MNRCARSILVRVKVERARENLRDLERVASAYRNQRQYAVVGQPQLGFSQASQDNLPRPIAVLPFQAVAIAGDVISNLRSALDHLAWQLVESAGGRPGRHTGFPIFDSLERYDKGKGGKVQGMRQEAIEAIDRLAPYRGPHGNEPLWRIHYLDNVNKHRTLFTVGREHIFIVEWMEANGLGSGFYVPASKPDFPGFFDHELEDEMDLAISKTFSDSQVAESDALIPSLHQLIDFVDGLVESFVPLLGDE